MALTNSHFNLSFQNQQINISASTRKAGADHIFFIHGLGCTRNSFSGAFDNPLLDKFSLAAIDCAAFGDSQVPDNFSYTIEDHAKILAKVIEQLPFERLHIAAHSFGGAVGLLLPENILARTATFLNCEGNLISADAGIISRRASLVPYAEFKSEFFEQMKKDLPQGPGCFELDRTTPQAFYESAKSLVEWSDSDLLIRKFIDLPCRKAYIYGSKNHGMPVIERLSAIRKFEIPNCGHFFTNDNPEDFYKVIYNFITA